MRGIALVGVCVIGCTLVFAGAVANTQTIADVTVTGGLVSVNVTDTELSEVVKAIGERAVPRFKVTAFRSRKVTAQFSDVPIVDALRLLIRKNFTLILDKKTHQPLKVFLLGEGEGVNTALLDQEATNEFQQILKDSPEQEVRVRVVLSAPLPLSEVKRVLTGKNEKHIVLKSLEHTSGTQSGGYLLEEGEPLEEAFASYERDQRDFVLQHMLQMQELVSQADNPEFREAAERGVVELKEVQQDFASHGLRITNLELKGKAQDIAEFQREAELIGDIERVKPQTQDTQER